MNIMLDIRRKHETYAIESIHKSILENERLAEYIDDRAALAKYQEYRGQDGERAIDYSEYCCLWKVGKGKHENDDADRERKGGKEF